MLWVPRLINNKIKIINAKAERPRKVRLVNFLNRGLEAY